jgi:hypothetical protein
LEEHGVHRLEEHGVHRLEEPDELMGGEDTG